MEPLTTRFNQTDPAGSFDHFVQNHRYLSREARVGFLQEVWDFYSIQAYRVIRETPFSSAKKIVNSLAVISKIYEKDLPEDKQETYYQLILNIAKVAVANFNLSELDLVRLYIPECNMCGWIHLRYVESSTKLSVLLNKQANGEIHLSNVQPSILWTLHRFQELEKGSPCDIDTFELFHLYLFAVDFDIKKIKEELFDLFYPAIISNETRLSGPVSEPFDYKNAIHHWVFHVEFSDHLTPEEEKKLKANLVSDFNRYLPNKIERPKPTVKEPQTGTSALFHPEYPYHSIRQFVINGFALSKKARELFANTVFKYFSEAAYLSRDPQPIPEEYRSRFALIDLPTFLAASHFESRDIKSLVISIQKMSGLVFDHLRKVYPHFLEVYSSPKGEMRWKVHLTSNAGSPGYFDAEETKLLYDGKSDDLVKQSPETLASLLSTAIKAHMVPFINFLIEHINTRFKKANVEEKRVLSTVFAAHLQEPGYERILKEAQITLNPDFSTLPEDLHSSVLILNSSINPDRPFEGIFKDFSESTLSQKSLEGSVVQKLSLKHQRALIKSALEKIHQQVKTEIDLKYLTVFCFSFVDTEICFFRERTREMYDYLTSEEVVQRFPIPYFLDKMKEVFPSRYPKLYAEIQFEKLVLDLSSRYPILKDLNPGAPFDGYRDLSLDQAFALHEFLHSDPFRDWQTKAQFSFVVAEMDFEYLQRCKALETLLRNEESPRIEILLLFVNPGCQLSSQEMMDEVKVSFTKRIDLESLNRDRELLNSDVFKAVFTSNEKLNAVYAFANQYLKYALDVHRIANLTEEFGALTAEIDTLREKNPKDLLQLVIHVALNAKLSQEEAELMLTLSHSTIIDWFAEKLFSLKETILNRCLSHLLDQRFLPLLQIFDRDALNHLTAQERVDFVDCLKDPQLIAVTTALGGIESRRLLIVKELEPKGFLSRLFNWT